MEDVIFTLQFAFSKALHRSSTFQQLPNHDKQLSNNQPRVVIIPTVDGGTPVLKKEGARVHLSDLEVKGFAKYVMCLFAAMLGNPRQVCAIKHGPVSAL